MNKMDRIQVTTQGYAMIYKIKIFICWYETTLVSVVSYLFELNWFVYFWYF